MWTDALLKWYKKNKRELPWRENPTPYHVWISEIMLQQTRVEAVKNYYKRFIEKIPNIKALSEIEEDTLLKLWEGLGYYTRARNLKKGAQKIMDEYLGVIPSRFDELLKIPGIGRYTAGAIASIAYHQKVPVVDGNVLRVMSRLLLDYSDITEEKTKRKWENYLSDVLIDVPPQEFNQALMEIGALVCVPNGLPNCAVCPLQSHCKAYLEEKIVEVPVKKKKKERKIENKTILLLFDGEKLAIRKRDSAGLLANLWELPNYKGHLSKKEAIHIVEQEGINVSFMQELEPTKHIFTHIEWHMIGYFMKVSSNSEDHNTWITVEELQAKYSLPTAFKTYESYFIKKMKK